MIRVRRRALTLRLSRAIYARLEGIIIVGHANLIKEYPLCEYRITVDPSSLGVVHIRTLWIQIHYPAKAR